MLAPTQDSLDKLKEAGFDYIGFTPGHDKVYLSGNASLTPDRLRKLADIEGLIELSVANHTKVILSGSAVREVEVELDKA
jgi:sugar phosphate isomerase/epimerase